MRLRWVLASVAMGVVVEGLSGLGVGVGVGR